MNCQDTNHLLDATHDLTRAQREAIDRHLVSCPACREDWANWREIAALPVPGTPVALHRRIAAALHSGAPTHPRRVFRPFLVGSLMLVGAVTAMAVVMQFMQKEPDVMAPVEASQEAPRAQGGGAPQMSQASSVAAPSEGTPAPASVEDAPLDPHAIVVLNRPGVEAGAREILLSTQCHDAIVRQLYAVRGLKVIADATVFPYEGDDRATRLDAAPAARFALRSSDREIARKLEALNVLIITLDNGCSAIHFNIETGAIVTGLSSGVVPPVQGWDSFAASIAQNIQDKTLKDGASVSADARAILLNTALSDRERMEAFNKLQLRVLRDREAVGSVFDSEALAAVTQLGITASDAGMRESVWAALRKVNDPSLVQPLLQALASDPDASVRMQAALTLNTFLNVPGVREALRRAATEDSSREPEVVCCVLTVREAAQRASIADADFRGWVRSTLFDESLPTRSRLLPLNGSTPDGRFGALSIADLGADAAQVVFDLGQYEQNPTLRQIAWRILNSATPNEAFVPVLLGDMTAHPNEYVRSNAAQVLARHVGKPEVRQAFERALQDPSMEVRRVAIRVTGASGN